MKRYVFNIFLKQVRVGAEWTSSGKSFQTVGAFNWEPMESFENRRCRCIFVWVCDNPSKCVLNTLHVETVQTPEERVAVIKAITHQGISQQHNSLICQILSNPPDIRHLKEVCLTNTGT